MAVYRYDAFDERGRLRHTAIDWSIYAAFAPSGNGRSMVKVGISTNIYERALVIGTNCPFPIDIVLWCQCGTRRVAALAEKLAHEALKPYSSHREWFEFDLQDPAHKTAFHSALKASYGEATGHPLKWRTTTAEQIRTYATWSKKERALARDRN